MNNKKNLFLIHETQKKKMIKSAKARVTGTIPYDIVMAKFPIPENCSCSSKINGLVMKTFSGK